MVLRDLRQYFPCEKKPTLGFAFLLTSRKCQSGPKKCAKEKVGRALVPKLPVKFCLIDMLNNVVLDVRLDQLERKWFRHAFCLGVHALCRYMWCIGLACRTTGLHSICVSLTLSWAWGCHYIVVGIKKRSLGIMECGASPTLHSHSLYQGLQNTHAIWFTISPV